MLSLLPQAQCVVFAAAQSPARQKCREAGAHGRVNEIRRIHDFGKEQRPGPGRHVFQHRERADVEPASRDARCDDDVADNGAGEGERRRDRREAPVEALACAAHRQPDQRTERQRQPGQYARDQSRQHRPHDGEHDDGYEAGNQPGPLTTDEPEIPAYLQDTYYWAYISPRNVPLLDREIVVRTILWQQHNKLQRLAFSEIEPGQRVMQPASVYGSFGPNLAKHVGPDGHVDIIDVARIQVNSTTRKLEPYPWAHAHHANCLHWNKGPYDVIVCYFLLHEVPDEVKHQVVDHLLSKFKVIEKDRKAFEKELDKAAKKNKKK